MGVYVCMFERCTCDVPHTTFLNDIFYACVYMMRRIRLNARSWFYYNIISKCNYYNSREVARYYTALVRCAENQFIRDASDVKHNIKLHQLCKAFTCRKYIWVEGYCYYRTRFWSLKKRRLPKTSTHLLRSLYTTVQYCTRFSVD